MLFCSCSSTLYKLITVFNTPKHQQVAILVLLTNTKFESISLQVPFQSTK